MLRISGENLVLIFLGVLALGRGIYIVKEECPPNEEYLLCGPVCPANCTNLTATAPCADDCAEGCFCTIGFVRDENGTCVSPDMCVPGSSEPCLNNDEVYDMCSGDCEPSCTDPEPMCNKICVGGCICASGLFRNESGDCVSVDKCPNNGTNITLLNKYLNAINNILHL